VNERGRQQVAALRVKKTVILSEAKNLLRERSDALTGKEFDVETKPASLGLGAGEVCPRKDMDVFIS